MVWFIEINDMHVTGSWTGCAMARGLDGGFESSHIHSRLLLSRVHRRLEDCQIGSGWLVCLTVDCVAPKKHALLQNPDYKEERYNEQVIQTLDTHIRHPSHIRHYRPKSRTDQEVNKTQGKKTPNPCVAFGAIPSKGKENKETNKRDIMWRTACR